jgi:K+-transporting ATPase ATPase C chain
MLTIILVIITGVIYPFVVTKITQFIFPQNAYGNLIEKDGRIIGSSLIGQDFNKPEYFHPRPSVVNYDASSSGGSNWGPTNKRLINNVNNNILNVLTENPNVYMADIPIDIVTSSASGLDPHISPQAAYLQVARVAETRKIDEQVVKKLVDKHIEERDLAVLGEQRVNVLLLNIDLDNL